MQKELGQGQGFRRLKLNFNAIICFRFTSNFQKNYTRGDSKITPAANGNFESNPSVCGCQKRDRFPPHITLGMHSKSMWIYRIFKVNMQKLLNWRRIYPFNKGLRIYGGMYHPPFDTLKKCTSTYDMNLKLYR